MPVKRKKKIFWPSITLLLVALLFLVAWWVLCDFRLPNHWLWKSNTPIAQTVAVPPESPRASEMDSGKDCVQQQLKLLGSARADAIEKAKKLYGRKSGGSEFVAYVASNQDGDPEKGPKGLETLGKRIEWNFTAKNGAKFHLDDVRNVCICHLWHSAYTPPLLPRHATMLGPILKQKTPHCFAYHVDGRGYPVKMPLEAVVNFYQHGGPANDAYRAMNSECFYAVDGATGERLYLDRGCFTCGPGEQQRIWPLDVRVGTAATLVVTVRSKSGKIGFPSGYGTVYLPAFWAEETSVLWCFTAREPYYGRDEWTYFDYFDRVSVSSVVPDVPKGAFHRTIKPDGVLGVPGISFGLPEGG